jgi:hypothetical protein
VPEHRDREPICDEDPQEDARPRHEEDHRHRREQEAHRREREGRHGVERPADRNEVESPKRRDAHEERDIGGAQ